MHVVLTRHRVLQCAAAGTFISGIVSAWAIMRLDKTLAQGKFLADIVERNVEHLNEFDLIALNQLGLTKNAEQG